YRAAGGAPHPSASSTSLEQALPLSLPTSLAYGSVQPGVGAAGAAGGTGEGKGGLPLRGAQLLVLVAEAARSGAPAWSACAQRLLWHCHQVLFRQLASWMIHGVMLDPHAEFFVASASGSTPGTQAASSTTDGFDWQTSYQVLPARLPSHIPLEQAEAIAFIGKSILLLRHNPSRGGGSDLLRGRPPPLTASGERRAGSGGADQGAQLLTHSETLEGAQALRALQMQPSWDRVAFGRVIEALRCRAASLLWHLVVVQADLLSHLAAFKDYFLMSRGELFHAFLVEARG
ncbi:hypothetical protein QJQ45_021220, partial [Haematococcus lacustris]